MKSSRKARKSAKKAKKCSQGLLMSAARLDKRKRELAQREWKRDMSSRFNGTIDPWYGCDLLDYVTDYALNYTYPWSNDTVLGFDVSDN